MKNKTIVLISPRVLGAEGQIRKAPPPFGIASLAATLIDKGYVNVHLIDAVVEDYDDMHPVQDNSTFITYGLSDQKMTSKVNLNKAFSIWIVLILSSIIDKQYFN